MAQAREMMGASELETRRGCWLTSPPKFINGKMDAIRRFIGVPPASSAPPRVETDDVYPLHILDDTKTLRGIIVTWTLRFNDMLDADKLHASLCKLLEIEDWMKIGGRLRRNDNRELEIYVPRRFTAERPAVSYSHQSHVVNIDELPRRNSPSPQ